MTKRDRLRRVTLLCCAFARNLAYYRAGWDGGRPKSRAEFWVTANGNFIDIAVLEWCKLFIDTKNRKPAEHRWEVVATDKAQFEAELLQAVGADQLKALKVEVRTYRNKFVAHLDDEKVMNIPHLDTGRASVWFYFGYIRDHEAQPADLAGLPADLDDYYWASEREARQVYGALCGK
jgi:hypothetical protein